MRAGRLRQRRVAQQAEAAEGSDEEEEEVGGAGLRFHSGALLECRAPPAVRCAASAPPLAAVLRRPLPWLPV
jgi:hypothetical protein